MSRACFRDVMSPAATCHVMSPATILHINVCQRGMIILPTGFHHSILDTCFYIIISTSSSQEMISSTMNYNLHITRQNISIFSSPTLSIFDYFPTHYFYIGLWRTRPNSLTDSSAVGGKQRCGFTSKVSLMPVCVVHISSK